MNLVSNYALDEAAMRNIFLVGVIIIGEKIMKKLLLFVICMIAVTATNAASFTTVTLPALTEDIRNWSDGSVYSPLFPSDQILAGVPFTLHLDNSGNNVLSLDGQITVDVDVFGITDVYTLINTSCQQGNIGSVTFNGSAGASHTVQLEEGVNMRDHYFGNCVNTTSAPYVTEAVFGINSPGHAHMDMQDFVLPDAFKGQTLTKIVFNVNSQGYAAPFLAGVTVRHSDMPVKIDIKPSSFPNSINPRSQGKTSVAILTTGPSDNFSTFDATTVDSTTVRFGPTSTEAPPVQHALEDVDGDGDIDMILHFNALDSGIKCGDTSATLTGATFDGQAIEGTDSIQTVGCK